MLVGGVALLATVAMLGPVLIRELRARTRGSSVSERVGEIAPRVEPIWAARFRGAGLVSAPSALAVVANKAAAECVVLGAIDAPSRQWVELTRYRITAASGTAGPKLREGDRQVPEGVYRAESLNPNSRFHLAIRVGYPSEADRAAATEDGRDLGRLGGDIMIHGGAASVGCIALGDDAIEELFWLVATVGLERTELVLTPNANPTGLVTSSTRDWLASRYQELDSRLAAFGLKPPVATP